MTTSQIMAEQPASRSPTAVNVGAQQVAAVYAKALARRGRERPGRPTRWSAELDASWPTCSTQYPEVRSRAGFGAGRRTRKRCRCSTACSAARSRRWCSNFLKVLATHGRLDSLRPSISEVQQAVRRAARPGARRSAHGRAARRRLSDDIARASLRKLLGGEPHGRCRRRSRA